jgi:hypothetical protein
MFGGDNKDSSGSQDLYPFPMTRLTHGARGQRQPSLLILGRTPRHILRLLVAAQSQYCHFLQWVSRSGEAATTSAICGLLLADGCSLNPDWTIHAIYAWRPVRYSCAVAEPELDRKPAAQQPHVYPAWSSEGRRSRLATVNFDSIFGGEHPQLSNAGPVKDWVQWAGSIWQGLGVELGKTAPASAGVPSSAKQWITATSCTNLWCEGECTLPLRPLRAA